MIDVDGYTQLVTSLLTFEKIELNFNSVVKKSFVYCMKNDYDKYLSTINNINVEIIKNNEEEYYYYLEGKIRYLYLTKTKVIFSKKGSELLKEVESLCELALSLNEYSYNANHCLADIKKSQKNYNEALLLFTKIFDYGFVTKPIIDNIIFVSIITSNWVIYKKYIRNSAILKDKYLLWILYFEFRYHILLFVYLISCLFFPIMFGWALALKLILPIICFYIFITLLYRRRIYYSYSMYLASILIVSILLYFLIRYL